MHPEKRLQEIKSLLKKHNISKGVLAQYLGKSQLKIRTMLNPPSKIMNREYYEEILVAINGLKELSQEEIYQRYIRGEKATRRIKNHKNNKEVRKAMADNGLKHSAVAYHMGLTSSGFNTIINRANKKDISDHRKEEILRVIKEILNKK